MSHKLYLSIAPKPLFTNPENTGVGGDYVVSLRSDTPDSCLASAAYDTVLRYFCIDNAEAFNVIARDERGNIVLDTQLPTYGTLSQYGLSASRL